MVVRRCENVYVEHVLFFFLNARVDQVGWVMMMMMRVAFKPSLFAHL